MSVNNNTTSSWRAMVAMAAQASILSPRLSHLQPVEALTVRQTITKLTLGPCVYHFWPTLFQTNTLLKFSPYLSTIFIAVRNILRYTINRSNDLTVRHLWIFWVNMTRSSQCWVEQKRRPLREVKSRMDSLSTHPLMCLHGFWVGQKWYKDGCRSAQNHTAIPGLT